MAEPQQLTNPFAVPLPPDARKYPRGLYDAFPRFPLRNGEIHTGYRDLARRIRKEVDSGLRVLVIDGYHGVAWDTLKNQLVEALAGEALRPAWVDMRSCLRPEEELREHLSPFLGGDDPLFGTRYPFAPEPFFDPARVARLRIRVSSARGEKAGDLLIVAGSGAGLLDLWDELWYADIPKDVIQAEARLGRVAPFGFSGPVPFGEFYKESYFVDWPALNQLKCRLIPAVDLFLDVQTPEEPAWMNGEAFRGALRDLAQTPFRVRPWFFPGPWGGQFMKGHMGLDPAQPNYAWSFELIVPENGIVLERGGVTLECSFDSLMFLEHERVLGREAGRQFKYEWPIRLDYLDTIDGGNLSTQCHPRPDYIRRQFGETYTQDETYYIVNAKPGARVYLGLTEACEPSPFRAALEESQRSGTPVDIDAFVHSEPSKPHDLFCIPNGTVHCSGKGNLVLEISATPYIFTFKIYDYLRRDLDGNLRTINVARAFENIRFERRPAWVRENLVARPQLLRSGPGWRHELLMDRPEVFYEVHRVAFDEAYEFDTEDRGFAVNLVAGEHVELAGASGIPAELHYLESMLIPAAANRVRIVNRGRTPCMMVLVFVRPGTGSARPLNDPSD